MAQHLNPDEVTTILKKELAAFEATKAEIDSARASDLAIRTARLAAPDNQTGQSDSYTQSGKSASSARSS